MLVGGTKTNCKTKTRQAGRQGRWADKAAVRGQGILKGGSITVPLTSCLTGLQIKWKIVSKHTADSKPVKEGVNGTVILPPLVFPAGANRRARFNCQYFGCGHKQKQGRLAEPLSSLPTLDVYELNLLTNLNTYAALAKCPLWGDVDLTNSHGSKKYFLRLSWLNVKFWKLFVAVSGSKPK
jgi:hypothetical protein